jgi:hypothetical protein
MEPPQADPGDRAMSLDQGGRRTNPDSQDRAGFGGRREGRIRQNRSMPLRKRTCIAVILVLSLGLWAILWIGVLFASLSFR